ncbi:MAG: MFS transporter [Chloroflexota bacterium]|nr:MFS transporter [Chloroflexota bacterium]
MSVLAAYRRVLSNGNLSRLLLGEFVSSIGDWLYLVALLIVVYERAADPVVLGLVGAARVLPYILLSVPAGIMADRFDRRLILLVTDLARGAIMVALALVAGLGGPVEAIVVLAVLATCFSAFFSPAIGSYIPSLVRDESELGPANSTWSTLDNLAFIIGPAVAGILIGLGGLTVAFALNAASFGLVAVVLWGLPSSRAGEQGAPTMEAPTSSEAIEAVPSTTGLSAALRPIALPLLGLNILGVVGSFVGGGLGVLTVVLAVDVFGEGDAGTGLLNAAVGAGGLFGAVLAGVLVVRRRLAPPVILGGVALAASVVLLGQTASLPMAMAAMAVGAAGGLLIEVVGTTLFQRIVPDAVRGRVIGGMETLAVAAYALGSFLLPVLAVSLGPGAVLGATGLLVALSLIVAVPLLGGSATRPVPADPDREALMRVPIFAGLPPARLEAAMAEASVLSVEGGQSIVRQGEPADRFYVIVEGTYEVTQTAGDETGVLRRMERGEVFGEIGLLTDGRRTATVTALEPGTLLSLDGQAFLDLVGSGLGLTSRLLDLHRGQMPVPIRNG